MLYKLYIKKFCDKHNIDEIINMTNNILKNLKENYYNVYYTKNNVNIFIY